MQQSAGEMVNKLGDIVWLVNPDQDSLQKLIQRLEEYARDMAAIKNMHVKINCLNIYMNMLYPWKAAVTFISFARRLSTMLLNTALDFA
jgi:hypothetical protein